MENEKNTTIDFAEARAALAGIKGKEYWRSMEALAETPEFKAWVDDEFPNRRSIADLDRRTFLKYMGASMALAGLAGCRGMFLDEQKVVPYVKMPEELVPGKPLFYATAMPFYGYGYGLLVESHEGRPTKIEGNPDHPASLGASRTAVQAAILGLYDPDRARNVANKEEVSNWEEFLKVAREALEESKSAGGEGIRFLTQTVTSPTLAAQFDDFKKLYPNSKWHQYEPLARDAAYEASIQTFGQPVNTVYDFAKAKVVVSLDADFLSDLRAGVRYSRDFASARSLNGGKKTMNRLYCFESTVTITGAFADHRWAVKPSEINEIGAALLNGINGGTAISTKYGKEIAAIVKDLKANRGECLVIAGDHQPAIVHSLAHQINQALASVGTTVKYTAPVEAKPVNQTKDLGCLVADMNGGHVKALFVLGGNPVFDAPSDLKFGDALGKVALKVHHGLYEDETSLLCDYHLPSTHFLETWSDVRAYDGTTTVCQPLTSPLYDAKSEHELLALLMGQMLDSHEIVQSNWKKKGIGADFEKAWREILNSGVVPNSAAPAAVVTAKAIPANSMAFGGTEIVFIADPSIGDGRDSNNGWLQEIPKPITQMVWDNAALISIQDAINLKVQIGDLLEVIVGGMKMNLPALPQSGQPEGVVAVYLGGGRTRGGTVQEGAGFNVYQLRDSKGMGFAGAKVQKADGYYKIETTQIHHEMEGRDIIRAASLSEYLAHESMTPEEHEVPDAREESARRPDHAPKEAEGQPDITMYPDEIFNTNLPQWGMTVDLSLCTGCNACITACQSENNIPVVGKEQVSRGREMQWIRIDRYYGPKNGQGNLEYPDVLVQPMMCVHCEKAPCEPVCPVGATLHSHEGLNQMVYNRCVGTRYCSNNCPYKVRRFNFLNFSDNNPQFAELEPTVKALRGNTSTPKKDGIQLLKMISNPDVTVRGRGVMEKCTYCVQRINDARIEAKKANREIADGEIVTACQQVCPTQTITFGNIADKNSAVSKIRKEPRAYRVLEALNTRPRTSYLGRVRNPNPEIHA